MRETCVICCLKINKAKQAYNKYMCPDPVYTHKKCEETNQKISEGGFEMEERKKLNAQELEAKERMNIMDMQKEIIEGLKEEPRAIYKSVDGEFPVPLSDVEQRIVSDFEEQHGYVVYHVVETNTANGKMVALLFVDGNESQWNEEREELLNHGHVFAFVHNMKNKHFSEFGTIGIGPGYRGGIMRSF